VEVVNAFNAWQAAEKFGYFAWINFSRNCIKRVINGLA
jgi:hypothetical protein